MPEHRRPGRRARPDRWLLPGRWVAAFGRFWWDFLIGDTPELFVGGVLAVGLAAALAGAGQRAAAVAALPVVVAGVLTLSLVRAGRRP